MAVQREAKLYVQRSKFNTRTKVETGDTEDQTIEVRGFLTEPAYVEVEASQTWNTAQYENVKISIGFKIPCYTEEVAGITKELTDKLPGRMKKVFTQYCAEHEIKYYD